MNSIEDVAIGLVVIQRPVPGCEYGAVAAVFHISIVTLVLIHFGAPLGAVQAVVEEADIACRLQNAIEQRVFLRRRIEVKVPPVGSIYSILQLTGEHIQAVDHITCSRIDLNKNVLGHFGTGNGNGKDALALALNDQLCLTGAFHGVAHFVNRNDFANLRVGAGEYAGTRTANGAVFCNENQMLELVIVQIKLVNIACGLLGAVRGQTHNNASSRSTAKGNGSRSGNVCVCCRSSGYGVGSSHICLRTCNNDTLRIDSYHGIYGSNGPDNVLIGRILGQNSDIGSQIQHTGITGGNDNLIALLGEADGGYIHHCADIYDNCVGNIAALSGNSCRTLANDMQKAFSAYSHDIFVTAFPYHALVCSIAGTNSSAQRNITTANRQIQHTVVNTGAADRNTRCLNSIGICGRNAGGQQYGHDGQAYYYQR